LPNIVQRIAKEKGREKYAAKSERKNNQNVDCRSRADGGAYISFYSFAAHEHPLGNILLSNRNGRDK
jgi:hypothetical protein